MFNINKNLVLSNVLFLGSLPVLASVNINHEYYQFREVIEERIEVLDQKLEWVEDRATILNGIARERMRNQYINFVQMRNNLRQKLASAENVTKDSWEKTKNQINYYTNILERNIDQAID